MIDLLDHNITESAHWIRGHELDADYDTSNNFDLPATAPRKAFSLEEGD